MGEASNVAPLCPMGHKTTTSVLRNYSFKWGWEMAGCSWGQRTSAWFMPIFIWSHHKPSHWQHIWICCCGIHMNVCLSHCSRHLVGYFSFRDVSWGESNTISCHLSIATLSCDSASHFILFLGPFGFSVAFSLPLSIALLSGSLPLACQLIR